MMTENINNWKGIHWNQTKLLSMLATLIAKYHKYYAIVPVSLY